MSPAPPHPPRAPRTRSHPPHALSRCPCAPSSASFLRAGLWGPTPRLVDPLSVILQPWPPFGGFGDCDWADMHPHPVVGLRGAPRDGDVGSWFRVGSCRRSWGEGWSSLSGCLQGPLPFPAAPSTSPTSPGGRDCPRVLLGLPQRNLETQHKLWPRLPFLCQQDLELRTPRSWVPSDEGWRVFYLDRQYVLRL